MIGEFFLTTADWIIFFLNRLITPEADKPAGGGQDSRQGIVKKKQETIFEISISSMHYFKIL
jgi:hypothetical protein